MRFLILFFCIYAFNFCGAQSINISEAPYLVTIDVNNPNSPDHDITGVLINNEWVLTQASVLSIMAIEYQVNWTSSCFFITDPLCPSVFRVKAGVSDPTVFPAPPDWPDNGDISDVAEVIIHPDFSGFSSTSFTEILDLNNQIFENNLALIRLTTPLNYNADIQPVNLATYTDIQDSDFDLFALITGYKVPFICY